MKRNCTLLLIACAVCLMTMLNIRPAAAEIPPPQETPAKIIVSGRTSTAKDITIVAVGQEVPYTFSGSRVGNTTGFSWYVSQHYAFKTDYPEEKARYYLELLELAYPQYVELFGREIPGIERKRMTVVYGASNEQMCKAAQSDGFTWTTFGGGGITQPGHNIAYQYPSGGLAYHQRYILLHECTHLYQMCLNTVCSSTPVWFFEGVAEGMGHHVYDPIRKQLTVWVLDKAPIHNQLDSGRWSILNSDPIPSFQELIAQGGQGYPGWFIMMNFLRHSPEYLTQFYVWRNEMFLSNCFREETMRDIFGGWNRINSDFEQWLDSHPNTFHYVAWGLEQNGSWLWSRSSRSDGYSRTDVLLAPGDNPSDDNWRMDYPREPRPEVVGQIGRGIAEPSVGAMLDLSLKPNKGRVGLGLGVVTDLPIVPFQTGELFIDEAGTKPGMDLSISELAGVAGSGLEADEVNKGNLLTNIIDTAITQTGLAKALGTQTEQFVAEWNGWIKTEEKNDCNFGLVSDDGSWLWIDDNEIVNNGGPHGMIARYGNVKLEPGMHKLRVLLYQGGGGFGIQAGLRDEQAHEPGMVKILIEDGKQLLVEGPECGIEQRITPLPETFIREMRSAGHKLGMNLKIEKKALVVTLRAQASNNSKMEKFTSTVSLHEKQRERLMTMPMSLLSQSTGGEYMDVHFGIMPFFDAGKILDPNMMNEPASINPFRLANCREANMAYEACWRLGKNAPDSLVRHRDALMSAAISGDETLQRTTADAFRQELPSILTAIETCNADAEDKNLVLDLMFGTSFLLTLNNSNNSGDLELHALLKNLLIGTATGTVSFIVQPTNALVAATTSAKVLIQEGTPFSIKQIIRNNAENMSFAINARAELVWYDRSFTLTATQSNKPSIPKWWVIGPFDNPGGGPGDVTNAVELQSFDPAATFEGKDDKQVHWQKVERNMADPVNSEFIVSFNHIYPPATEVSAYAFVYINSPCDTNAVLAVGAEDGEVAWLNGERVLTHLCGGRAYRAKSENAPIHLKKGVNELMIKITLGFGGWVFSAQILDENGAPVPGLHYSLD